MAKIQEISDYKRPSEHGIALSKSCWIVKQEILDKFELTNLEIPNNWEYTLELPNKTTSVSGTPTVGEGGTEATACDTPKSDRSTPGTPASALKPKVAPASLITKFTKVLSEEERQSQFLASKQPTPATSATPSSDQATPSSKTASPAPTASGSGGTPSSSSSASKSAKKRIQPTLVSIAAVFGKSLLNAEKPKTDKPDKSD